ncbi:hypothetical protein Cni_G27241 [Canna indica]|uniref:RING-type E3 ubiquitin transferase n=1 Tax=Canna indica TaxID=4628 RepID=A0AAQ3L552_9LILI|nr:hypothetical protein Cni_G27241 [Canna indica]
MDANHDDRLNPTDSDGYSLSGKIMLVCTVVLFSAILFLLFFHLYLRSRFLLRRRQDRRGGRRRSRRLSFAVESAGGAFLSSAVPDRRGLDLSVLKSLPVVVFAVEEEEAGEDDAAECAVCLSGFEEGEKMRALPRCGHRFHIECIDMWFNSHATCPLCRSVVEAVGAAKPIASLPAAAHRAMPPESSPPEPERPSRAGVNARCWGEEGLESPASSSAVRELRIEEAGRGCEGEVGIELKSPGRRMPLLTRLLSRDSRSYRGGGTAVEPDLERGQGTAPNVPMPQIQ